MHGIISYGHFPIRELAPHKNQGMEITYIEKGVMEWMVEGLLEHTTLLPGNNDHA